jgi:predicted amidophosphoribosyltransferase
MAGSVNRGRNLVCCYYCGRDTRAADAVCSRCRGISDQSEVVGRRQLPVTRAKTPFDAAEECPYEPRAAERYHGESIRDDL